MTCLLAAADRGPAESLTSVRRQQTQATNHRAQPDALLLRSGGRVLHALLHTRFPIGLKLLHLGLLIRSKQLK
jgi:hypothetical protein